MPRYIDAEPLKKQIADFKKAVNSPNSDYVTGYVSALSATEGVIAGLPTADVVEVVRCKDCKYFKHFEGCGNWCHRRIRSDIEYHTKLNDFCSYGERKEK